jgi:hypothetical protein
MRAARKNAMADPIELVAALAPGQTQTPKIINPDGTFSPFVMPPKMTRLHDRDSLLQAVARVRPGVG